MTLTLQQMQQIARLTAVELVSLMNEKKFKAITPDEYFNTQQAAKYIGVTVGWINRHINGLPHKKVARFNKFKKSGLDKFIERT